MAHVALFHSVLGLRPVERRAAERLRAAGHDVNTPDLYAGATATTLDGGFAIVDRIGWPTIESRALDAVADLPPDTVLAGISMGASVVGTLLPHRPRTAVPAAIPAQLHVADPDSFAPPATWPAGAQIFTYPGVGHFYTDDSLPDHDARAAELTWQRAISFLASRPGAAPPHRT